MDNHVHLVLVPKTIEGLAKAVAETNRYFACKIIKRYGWKGYLWQGRFISFVMDDNYLIRTLRYVENNPVRAKIVEKPWDYLWSSARKHVNEGEDSLIKECPAVQLISDWKDYLMRPEINDILDEIRKHNLSGMPLGGNVFIEKIAKDYGLNQEGLIPKPVGRPQKR